MNYTHTPTWGAGAGEVPPLSALSDISAGGVVATGSLVAAVELLAEDSCEAVLTLAVERVL